MITTTPIDADLREILAAVSAATNLKAADIVRGSGRAAGHVAARHAAFYLLGRRGHGATAIGEAFGQSRTGVLASIGRIGFHSKARDVIERARANLSLQLQAIDDFRK